MVSTRIKAILAIYLLCYMEEELVDMGTENVLKMHLIIVFCMGE